MYVLWGTNGEYLKYNFKYSYCVSCRDTFGYGCMQCQDFNDCAQHRQDYNRLFDAVTCIWYCQQKSRQPRSTNCAKVNDFSRCWVNKPFSNTVQFSQLPARFLQYESFAIW